MMQLQINGKQKQRLWLTKSHYSIGNSATCDIRIADKSVRGLHAHLIMDGDIPSLVREEGAAVQLNGVPLEMESRLMHGDRIRIGNTDFQIRDSHQAVDLQKTDEPPLGWELQGMNAALAGKHFAIETVVVVGRANECDMHLAEAHLSRRHAQLRVTADGLEIEDLDSANGTFVNGRRISKATLKSGDELCFDTLRFRVIHTATTDGDDQLANETLIRPSEAHSGAAQEAAQGYKDEVALGQSSHQKESDRQNSGHGRVAAGEPDDGTINARGKTESSSDPSDIPHEIPQDIARSSARDSSREGEPLDETASDPEPVLPTAIEIQLETLRRQREERRGLAGASSMQPVGGILEGGRLALMMALIALAGVIWGAMSFFDPLFFSAPTSLIGSPIK